MVRNIVTSLLPLYAAAATLSCLVVGWKDRQGPRRLGLASALLAGYCALQGAAYWIDLPALAASLLSVTAALSYALALGVVTREVHESLWRWTSTKPVGRLWSRRAKVASGGALVLAISAQSTGQPLLLLGAVTVALVTALLPPKRLGWRRVNWEAHRRRLWPRLAPGTSLHLTTAVCAGLLVGGALCWALALSGLVAAKIVLFVALAAPALLIGALAADALRQGVASASEAELLNGSTHETLKMLGIELHQRQNMHRSTGRRLSLALRAGGMQPWEANLETGALYRPLEGDGRAVRLPASSVQDYLKDVDPSDQAKLLTAWLSLTSGDARRHTAEYRVQVRGEVRHMLTSAEVVFLAGLGVRVLAGVTRDVTELVRAREVEAARRQAVAVNQARSEFMSRLTHEMRTPLNAVIGFGRLLQIDPKLPAAARERGGHVAQAGDHLLQLVTQVLDLASFEAGAKPITEVAPVRLSTLLAGVHAMMANSARAANVSFEVRSETAPAVLGQETRVRQIVLNLVSNAIKYNRRGGAVEVWCTCEAGATFVHVSDTGEGLTQEELSKLFVAFHRLAHHRQTVEGHGIGLALSRQLAHAMGGDIGVTSVKGEGSCFTLTLPTAGLEGPQHVSDPVGGEKAQLVASEACG